MKKLLLAITFLGINLIGFSQTYWEEIQNVEPYGALNKVVFVNSQSGWAFGQNGIIMHTNDGGNSWEYQYNNPGRNFKSAYFINENEGWVVGWSQIMHTIDGGVSWEDQTRPPFIGDLTDVYFINPDTGFLVGWNNQIHRTSDGGQTWQNISNPNKNQLIFNKIRFFDEMNGIICGVETHKGGVIYLTSDGGLSWTKGSLSSGSAFVAMDINSDNQVFVGAHNGEMYYSSDMGQTWNEIDQGINSMIDIVFDDDQNGYFLDHYVIRKSTDNGLTWTLLNSFDAENLRSLSPTTNSVYGCGSNTSVYKYSVDGSQAARQHFYTTISFRKMAFINKNKGFALTGNGAVFNAIKTDDGGQNWYVDSNFENQYCKTLKSNGNKLYYIVNDELRKTSDGGQSWETNTLPAGLDNYVSLSIPESEVLFVCSDSSQVFKSTDDGENWQQITFSDYHKFTISYFYNANFGWLVDDYSGFLARTKDGGISWDFMKVDPQHTYVPSSIYFIDENTGFITTEIGWLYRTDDGGENWEKVLESDLTVAPAFHFVNQNEGYFINRKNIYYSNDGGLNWIKTQELSSSVTASAFSGSNSWLGGAYSMMAINNDLMNVSENENLSFNFYPNPTSKSFFITFDGNQEQNVEIINLEGKVIFSSLIESSSRIDISDYKKGIYFINVKTPKGVQSKKLIIN